MAHDRARARYLAAAALSEGRPLGWFEELYAEAASGVAAVPWADLRPNPHLVAWLEGARALRGRALVVGCGFGDDAEELARRGFAVTAFDVAPSAVAEARRRFPTSAVSYEVADLLGPPAAYLGAFDLVVEAYTLQVLPPPERHRAEASLRSSLAPGGILLVIARGREPGDPPGNMPWPLTRAEIDALAGRDLSLLSFGDFLDDEDPPVRRFRAAFRRAV